MRVAKVPSNDVPVRLFALSGQLDEVNENRLQMLDELFGGGEAAFGILTTGGPGAACGRLLLLSHNLTVWPSVSGH